MNCHICLSSFFCKRFMRMIINRMIWVISKPSRTKIPIRSKNNILSLAICILSKDQVKKRWIRTNAPHPTDWNNQYRELPTRIKANLTILVRRNSLNIPVAGNFYKWAIPGDITRANHWFQLSFEQCDFNQSLDLKAERKALILPHLNSVHGNNAGTTFKDHQFTWRS